MIILLNIMKFIFIFKSCYYLFIIYFFKTTTKIYISLSLLNKKQQQRGRLVLFVYIIFL